MFDAILVNLSFIHIYYKVLFVSIITFYIYNLVPILAVKEWVNNV